MIVPGVLVLLTLIAAGLCVASVVTRVPLWTAVFVICLIELLHVLPVK